MISRRAVLTGGAGIGIGTRSVLAAGAFTPIVVGTWGGDYGTILQQSVDQSLVRPLGIDVVQDINGNDPRRTKIMLERAAQRGRTDVACLNDLDTYMLNSIGALEPLSAEVVPRFETTLPGFRKPYAVPHIHSVFVIVYNPERMKAPPRRYSDLLDPRNRGRVGLSDAVYSYVIAAMALAGGGTASDIEQGKAVLRNLKSLEPRIYPSNESIASALKTEEIWLSVMWLARGFMWKAAGLPIATAVPDEGAIPIVFEAAIPRNAPRKAEAFRYLNALLDPAAQIAFARRMGYLPTVQGTTLPDDLRREISLTDDQYANLKVIDHSALQAQRGAMLDFWNKEFKA